MKHCLVCGNNISLKQAASICWECSRSGAKTYIPTPEQIAEQAEIIKQQNLAKLKTGRGQHGERKDAKIVANRIQRHHRNGRTVFE